MRLRTIVVPNTDDIQPRNFVHYDPATGTPRQYSQATAPFDIEGLTCAEFIEPDYGTATSAPHVVDLTSITPGDDVPQVKLIPAP
jgi:hypothetical protein